MKLFRFRGGIHPDAHKTPTADKPIETLPIPERLYVPLQQHVGAPANPEVAVGQTVFKGQLLAHSQGLISAPVHAPTSGKVIAIGDFTAPHPSGLPVRTITLEADGADRWIETAAAEDPFSLDPDEISIRVGAAGIVGMGGATFPSAVKLKINPRSPVQTLIINGGECEPYLTCDDRLMRERADAIVDGIRIMQHGLQCQRALIAIEDNKPEAIAAMTRACDDLDSIEVVKVPSLYPMGSEKQMIQTLTGMEIPAGMRATDIGVIVHNVGTAYAVHDALRQGRPLVARVVTISGGAIARPANLEVPIGVLIDDLLRHCGGTAQEPARLLMGGPMMGQVLPHTHVPVIKGSNGVIALTAAEIRLGAESPCIRCGSCISACPCGLLPLEMAARARKGDVDGAVDYGVMDCISCGSCAYVCPANIPLVQYFNYAKGQLATNSAAKMRGEETRKLAEKRKIRIEREAEAKAEARRRAKEAAQRAKAAREKAQQTAQQAAEKAQQRAAQQVKQ